MTGAWRLGSAWWAARKRAVLGSRRLWPQRRRPPCPGECAAGTSGSPGPHGPIRAELHRVWWRCVVLDLVVVLVTIVSFALMWAVLRGLERM